MSTSPALRGPFKAWLFDLDGTLVDTAPDLGHAANRVRAELAMEPLPLPVYRPVASAGARGLLGVALGIGPEHADFPQRRDSFLAHYRAELCRESVLFPGLDPLLVQAELRGLPWGVVTNKPGWLTRPLLKALRLETRCACAISGDDVPRPKPAPDGLLQACAQLGLTPGEVVYVGDDRRDIEAARAAGMPSIAAGWGYIGEAGPAESWQADAVAESVAELARLLG
ncbi:MAG TPA: HAD-IA family hydrolase [Nevskiaceae bacterium]|nr:HAD-IA family hydrolase [Nevskiaceae bacterium]